MFDLMAVFDALVEHAVFVADAVAVGRQAQRGQRIEETGREAAEAAVAERRIGFELAHGFEVETDLAEGLSELVGETDVDQAVGKGVADGLGVEAEVIVFELGLESLMRHGHSFDVVVLGGGAAAGTVCYGCLGQSLKSSIRYAGTACQSVGFCVRLRVLCAGPPGEFTPSLRRAQVMRYIA